MKIKCQARETIRPTKSEFRRMENTSSQPITLVCVVVFLMK